MLRNSKEIFTLCEQFLARKLKNRNYDTAFAAIRPIARAAGVTEQTVFRWIRRIQEPEPAHIRLIEIAACGLAMPDEWRFFRFRRDALWFNEAYFVTCTDLRRLFDRRQNPALENVSPQALAHIPEEYSIRLFQSMQHVKR